MKIKGIYLLYRTLQVFGLPVLLLYFLFRSARQPAYWRTLPERLGFLPDSLKQTGPGAIWLHAVSVGEALAIRAALPVLRAALPRTAVVVSTSTLAGRALAQEKLAGLADGVFYAPLDFVFAVRRVLRALRPSVVAVVETEIWPNLIREAKRTGAGVTIVNGRISGRALPRYRRFRWFFRSVLAQVDSILAQDETMRARFVQAGAEAGAVRVGGNLKFDFEARAAASPAMQYLQRARPGKVWIAASTMPPAGPGDVDEDDVALAAFREISLHHPDLLLVLAPRKPERFEAAARKLEAAGLPYARRSLLGERAAPEDPAASLPRVLLLDSIGELSGLFAAADAVFLGGTLARRGGHNLLEPALFGKPAIVGPHMENFQSIADEFQAQGACLRIERPEELGGAVRRLLEDSAAASEIGRRAQACAEAQRGAQGRAVEEIRELHSARIPRYRPAMPWYAAAAALARVWQWGGARRRRRGAARRRALDVPVIGVGNLAMGGTGKTPCVARLAGLLAERGRRPGILTRGYGRAWPNRRLVLGPGASVPTALAGDEPRIFLRAGVAPVGIGTDRFETGQRLRREFGVDAFLLDDGFQHVRLARNVDLVLLDALDPLAGGGVFPLGRLREPWSALARADIAVITRSESSGLCEAIERALRRANPAAPVFRARLEALEWVEHSSGARFRADAPPFERAAGFCGLANPRSFRKTLAALGIHPVAWAEFGDHHRYRPGELRRMARRWRAQAVTAVVTTEKDALNLCPGWQEALRPAPLYWLRVEMRFEREGELLAEIERLMATPPR